MTLLASGVPCLPCKICEDSVQADCFTFTVSGVTNNPPPPPWVPPGCSYCPDYNGTWTLIPNKFLGGCSSSGDVDVGGPIGNGGQSCTFYVCRPPVCCNWGTLNEFRYTLQWSNIAIPPSSGTWFVETECGDVIYTHDGQLDPSQPTDFKLNTFFSTPSVCSNWPAKITLKPQPMTISSVQKSATNFIDLNIAPHEPATGKFPWKAGGPGGCYFNSSDGQVTDYLLCNGFNFTSTDIPATAIVLGFVIEVDRYADEDDKDGSVKDNSIRIGFSDAFPSGRELASQAAWDQGPPAVGKFYGAPGDDFGTGATPGMIWGPYFGVWVSANMRFARGNAYICGAKITVYYATPCEPPPCCACASTQTSATAKPTVGPPSAYSITLPPCPSNCHCALPGSKPGCDATAYQGQTYELPRVLFLETQLYTCVYQATFGKFTFTLNISNLNPDARQWTLLVTNDASCAQPAGAYQGLFNEWLVQESSVNRAVQPCDKKTLNMVQDPFNSYCTIHIGIGGPPPPPGPTCTVTPIP